MLLLHGLDRIMDQLISHNHLDLPLRHMLDLPRLTEKRLAALQRAKLALTQYLPAALIVLTNTPTTRAEYRSFHGIQMRFRHIKTQLVHRSPRRKD